MHEDEETAFVVTEFKPIEFLDLMREFKGTWKPGVDRHFFVSEDRVVPVVSTTPEIARKLWEEFVHSRQFLFAGAAAYNCVDERLSVEEYKELVAELFDDFVGQFFAKEVAKRGGIIDI